MKCKKLTQRFVLCLLLTDDSEQLRNSMFAAAWRRLPQRGDAGDLAVRIAHNRTVLGFATKMRKRLRHFDENSA
jgi:hypothetical protein